MNYTTQVFLINPNVRALRCSYEGSPKDQLTVFKTLDASIEKDDLVVVPTQTRVGFTVVKVVETNVEVDFDSTVELAWVAGRFSRKDFDRVVAEEHQMVMKIKGAMAEKKKRDLREALEASIGTLPMLEAKDDKPDFARGKW